MRVFRFRSGALWAALAVSLFAVGCQQDLLVHENFAQIRPHTTTQAEVERLIGQPDRTLRHQWLYERPNKHLTALVDFDERGSVTRKQWIDGLGEVWEDSAEGSGQASPNQSVYIESHKD